MSVQVENLEHNMAKLTIEVAAEELEKALDSVPEAKEAMSRFKEEVASELGVPLKEGYNGDLTSKQAGSIGGEMVKQMIMKQEQQMK